LNKDHNLRTMGKVIKRIGGRTWPEDVTSEGKENEGDKSHDKELREDQEEKMKVKVKGPVQKKRPWIEKRMRKI
jgi:hypothetical protein